MRTLIQLTTMLILALAPPTMAREAQDRPALAAQGAFFALHVRDLDASARWYAETFGLETKVEMRGEGLSMTALEGGGRLVELIQNDDARTLTDIAPTPEGGDPLRVHGYFKAGIMVEDLTAAVADLRARGVTIVMGPFPARPDQRANAVIRDNEGNYIQLLGAYAPRSGDAATSGSGSSEP